MNLLENMLMIYNNTRTEDTHHMILNKWLNNLDKITGMKIIDLADFSYTSPSTISRLIRLFGFTQYSTFMHSLRECLDRYPGLNRFFSASFASDTALTQYGFLNSIESFCGDIREMIENNSFAPIAEAMNHSAQVIIFSYGSIMCEWNLQLDLFMSGVNCEVIPYDYAKLEYSKQLIPNSFLLMISSGRSDDLNITSQIIRTAAEKQCKICLISSSVQPNCADKVHFLIRPKGNRTIVDAFFTQLFICVLGIEYRNRYIDASI